MTSEIELIWHRVKDSIEPDFSLFEELEVEDDGIEFLKMTISDEGSSIGHACRATHVAAMMGKDGLEAVNAALTHSSPDVRAAAAYAIGVYPSEFESDALVKFAQSEKNASVLATLLSVLAKLSVEDAAIILEAVRSNPNLDSALQKTFDLASKGIEQRRK